MKSTEGKIFRCSQFHLNMKGKMKSMSICYVCGKENLSKDEVGITKKLLGKNEKRMYCLACLAERLEVTEEELTDKIEEFKEEGCTLFI